MSRGADTFREMQKAERNMDRSGPKATMEQLAEAMRSAIDNPGPPERVPEKPWLKDRDGRVIDREMAAALAKPEHLRAFDLFLSGKSVLLCDVFRSGKTITAKAACNALIDCWAFPKFVTEAEIFRRLSDGQSWKCAEWQIIDNAFSPDNWIGYTSRSDDSNRLRWGYRDYVVDAILDAGSSKKLFVTCANLPGEVEHMQQDLSLRWMETFAEVIDLR